MNAEFKQQQETAVEMNDRKSFKTTCELSEHKTMKDVAKSGPFSCNPQTYAEKYDDAIWYQARCEFLEKQLENLRTALEELKIDNVDLKSRLADETSPTHRGFWENRVGELTLKNMQLEERNDYIIDLLTEDQVEELMRMDKEKQEQEEEEEEEE